MSYILEALKKAEAAREQGGVPGLSSQAWTPPTAATIAKPRPPGRRLIMGLIVVALCGLSLWLGRSSGSDEGPLKAKAQEDSVAQVPPLQALAASQGLAQQLPATTVPRHAAPTAVAQAPVKTKVVKASASASASDSVLKWASLTPTERQKLPKLQWGGAMYSPDPNARMAIINEQVMREGDSLGAGLALERIEANFVILNLQGQRIRWDF